jgi:hypothetical protein
MQTTEQARALAATRRAEFYRAAERAQLQIRDITDRARSAGRDSLTPAEDQLVDGLLGRRDSARQSMRDLDASLAEFDAALAGERDAAALQSRTRPNPLASRVRAASGRDYYDRAARIGYEARTYRPDTDPKGVGFLRDVAANFMSRDPASSERLARHVQEERVERPSAAQRAAGDSTTANWAGLTVPQYLTDLFAPSVVPLRPFADICNRSRDLPSRG